MKLSEWAESQGIHYMTAWRWWKSGKLPVPAYQTPSGSIIVELPAGRPGRTVIYTRVSSHDQRADLDRQVARVTRWATQEGLTVRVVVADAGETTDDLMRDMIDVLTSFCVRLYGRHGARNRAMRAVTATKQAKDRAA